MDTIKNQNTIKREALDKLDSLIVFELKRLYSLSPTKPIYHQFELHCPDFFFTEAERNEIRRNINYLQRIQNADIKEKKEGILYLLQTMTFRGLYDPWFDPIMNEEDNNTLVNEKGQ